MISKKKNEDAVSPVIGVMLMLVVTVVIAAVVVGFSTGLAGSTGTTPTALFEVSNSENGADGTLAYMNLRHKGGDVISLADLQITLESVGEENSGIIQIFLATDSKESIDMSDLSSYTPPWKTQAEYEQARAEAYGEYGTIGRSIAQIEMFEQMLAGKTEGTQEYDEILNDMNFERQMLQESIDAFENEWTNALNGMYTGGEAYPVSVLGQTVPTKSTVSTGEIIHIVPFDGKDGSSKIYTGSSVKWTISYIPTNSVIAKGEFEVIAD